jgi:hypothetical protein
MYSVRSNGTSGGDQEGPGHKRATSNGPRRRPAVTHGRHGNYGLDVNPQAQPSCKRDLPRMLVQLEPIGTAVPRAANAVRAQCPDLARTVLR